MLKRGFIIFFIIFLGVLSRPVFSQESSLQTHNKQPVLRTVTVQLPLKNVLVQWMFTDVEALMASHLTLFINDQRYVILDGQGLTSDWLDLSIQQEQTLGIYFQFRSRIKLLTAPRDRLRLEWVVPRAIAGEGVCVQGIVPAGTYRAKAKFSLLTDNPEIESSAYAAIIGTLDVPTQEKEKLLESVRYKAFAEKWSVYFPVTITQKKTQEACAPLDSTLAMHT